jgi:hypothetical protein
MDRLAARLRAATSARTLSSALVDHTEVESPGLGDLWEHVKFLDAFFDAVEDE